MDLADDLRTDRTTRTRDEHPLTGEHRTNGVEVGGDLLAAEQILDLDIAHIAQRDTAAHRRRDAGHDLERDVGLLGIPRSPTDRLLRGVRHREHGEVRAGSSHNLGQQFDVAMDRDTHERAAVMGGVFVENGDRSETGTRAAQHVGDEARSGVAGSDHHDLEALLHLTAVEREEARLETDKAHQERRQDRGRERHRRRHPPGHQVDEHQRCCDRQA